MNKVLCINGKVFGSYEVSDYGLGNKRMDYGCLADIVGGTLCSSELADLLLQDYEIYNGDEYNTDIYQWIHIGVRGADFLNEYTNELVLYNYEYDSYLWGINHFGTSWDYVLTDIELNIKR